MPRHALHSSLLASCLLLLAILCACEGAPTLQEQAESLVADVMAPRLDSIGGYEPVATTIDSLNEVFVKNDLISAMTEVSTLEREYEQAQDAMMERANICRVNANAPDVAQLRAEFQQACNRSNDIGIRLEKKSKTLDRLFAARDAGQFGGYLISHTYLTTDAQGHTHTRHILIIAPPDVSTALRIYDNPDPNIEKTLQYIRE